MDSRIKTLLLNLPININDVSDYNGVLQPVGLSVISSFLKQQGCNVTLYDAFAYHEKRDNIIAYIKELNPKIIGVTLMTNHLPQTLPFLKDVKLLFPDVVTVVGGAHPSAAYESLLQNNNEVDVAVIGEGEYTMLDLIKSVQNGESFDQVKGIAWRPNGKVKVNPFREYIQDLDSLPFSDWESLPMENYFDVWTIKKNYANMILSRGCPFRCTFCGAKNALGRKQRKRSPEHILGEIKLLYDKYNVRNLLFSDSTLNVDNQWVQEICEGLLKLNKSLVWGCNIRADRIDKETLKLMKKSGCVKLFIGVESADNRILKSMRKGENIEKIEEGIRLINEAGLIPDMGFILGMPGETEESMKRTIEFAKRHKKSVCAFTLASPFPGTELYEDAKKEGFMVEDWSKFDIYSIAYVPKGLTRKKLEYYYKLAAKSNYLRLSYFYRQMSQIKSWVNFKIYLRLAYRIFFNRLLKLEY